MAEEAPAVWQDDPRIPELPVGRPTSRLDERHIAVRFDDHRRPDGHWHIWFNDVQVENAVDEAYAGHWGWVHTPLDDRVLIGRVAIQTCSAEPCALKGKSEQIGSTVLAEARREFPSPLAQSPSA